MSKIQAAFTAAGTKEFKVVSRYPNDQFQELTGNLFAAGTLGTTPDINIDMYSGLSPGGTELWVPIGTTPLGAAGGIRIGPAIGDRYRINFQAGGSPDALVIFHSPNELVEV